MKKSLFFGMAALIAAGMTSCSNDEVLLDSSKPLENDESYFVNININSTDALTRADAGSAYANGVDLTKDPAFSAGTDTENKVETIFLIFYDEDGNRVSTTQVRKNNLEGPIPGSEEFPSENSLYRGIVQIDLKHGSKVPTQVMCFINPISGQNFDINPEFETLDKLDKYTRPRIIADDGSFAMSKSMYYKKNGNKYEKVIATPIEQGQLFKQIADAEDALEKSKGGDHSSMVDIYVERYAVKVNFNMADAQIQEIDVDGKKLKFVPEYWAVNAYESETYVTKSFYRQNMTDVLTYDDLDGIINTSTTSRWNWNSAENHRCYWAQSPAYYSQFYPRVADDILDKQMTYAAGGYSLGYYSYEDLEKLAKGQPIDSDPSSASYNTDLTRKARDLRDVKDAQRPIYARENTVSGDALHAAANSLVDSPKAAIPSVVMVGHYEVDNQKIDNDEIFYVSGNAVNGYSFFNEDEMLTYFVNTTLHFAKDQRGTPFFSYGVTGGSWTDRDYKKYFKIEHPNILARNGLVIDSRFVTIQLNDAEIGEGEPLYALLDGKWTRVIGGDSDDNNIAEVNQQLLLQAGTVQGFKGGLAYYTIPIKHLGFYRDNNANANKNANDKDFDWQAVQSGDFGLVRNHVYTINVTKIEGLGNGIPDPSHPIVPPTDPEEYYIGARIIVLNWAVVPQQDVQL